MTTASRTWRVCQYTTHTAKGLNKQTYNDERIRDPSDDVELLLERQREVAEHAAGHVDENEEDRDADHLLVLVDLVVLRAGRASEGSRRQSLLRSIDAVNETGEGRGRRGQGTGTYKSAEDKSIELMIPKNCTGLWFPRWYAGCGQGGRGQRGARETDGGCTGGEAH